MDRRLISWLRLTLAVATVAGAASMTLRPGSAAPIPDSPGADPRGDYLCPPRVQIRHPEFCPDLGPGAALLHLAQAGLYPEMPLPTVPIEDRYFYVPTEYLRAKSGESVRLFPSVEDARRGSGETGRISPGFVFLYYREKIEEGGSTVYATGDGYVRSSEAGDYTPPNFHGEAFSRTPDRPFGWVISGTFTQAEPGSEIYTENWLPKFSLVQIFGVERVGEWDWYRIGRNEWIEQRNVARVVPDATPPEGVDADRWITVNLYEQTLTAYRDGQLVYATMVSTGRNGFWTKPGLFQVWAKLERDLMTGGIPDDPSFYYLQNVPWVLYFDKARAIHGTYWHAKFGTTTSRGCVNVPLTDAQWIFDFAEEGTYVYVFDPSGQTPTDPAVYGEGGA
ncbi:MAG TPA: L,D-transpeptidase family protein [Anaerolineales bacterium]|nr:L,D-transpeptidase family protein [Anaerolineales bacterium]